MAGASVKCPGCQGSGMKVSIRHLSPSIIQQTQHPCNDCKGTGGGSSIRQRQRRGENVIHPLKVTLEDLYNGTSKKLSLSHIVLCSKCKGKGSNSGPSMKCPGCQGSGMLISIRHLDSSMIQKMQYPCNECKGTGETIKERCPHCKGEKVVQEKKVLEVIVEKGMQNGQKITFAGEADEAPDTVTGDIVFVLQQKEHPKFKRKGDDLFVEHTLSLSEALCGFHFMLTHLDNRQVLIKSEPGEVVKPDQVKTVNDEGMPMYQRPFMKGKLYILFSVDFPESLNPDQCKALEATQPPKSSVQLTESSGQQVDKPDQTTSIPSQTILSSPSLHQTPETPRLSSPIPSTDKPPHEEAHQSLSGSLPIQVDREILPGYSIEFLSINPVKELESSKVESSPLQVLAETDDLDILNVLDSLLSAEGYLGETSTPPPAPIVDQSEEIKQAKSLLLGLSSEDLTVAKGKIDAISLAVDILLCAGDSTLPNLVNFKEQMKKLLCIVESAEQKLAEVDFSEKKLRGLISKSADVVANFKVRRESIARRKGEIAELKAKLDGLSKGLEAEEQTQQLALPELQVIRDEVRSLQTRKRQWEQVKQAATKEIEESSMNWKQLTNTLQ